jgi:CubicO group peptidase (beta-lactamase class C family)
MRSVPRWLRTSAIALATLCMATVLSAQEAGEQSAGTAAVGIDPARMTRLTTWLEGAVDRGELAGAVAFVVRDGMVVYDEGVGMADIEAGRPMTSGTLFRIASQTKAITSTAIMMLVEEGIVGLGDPVGKWMPELARLEVMERHDSAGMPRWQRVAPKRAITIKDLLTHTSGLSYGRDAVLDTIYTPAGLGGAAGQGWYFADRNTDMCTALAPLGHLPTISQPGERWVYGYSTDVLGCVVERASGESLADFFRERITGPLGMDNTMFCVPADRRSELATVYALGADRKLVRAPEGPLGQGHYVDGPCRAFSGGAGLVSTARDYGVFLQMLLEGGMLNGVRILSPASVVLMTTNQVGTLYGAPASGHGLAFQTWEDPTSVGRYGSSGSYGWGGAYHSNYFVDPANRLVAVIMTQLMPATGSVLHDRFRTLVYQAVVD